MRSGEVRWDEKRQDNVGWGKQDGKKRGDAKRDETRRDEARREETRRDETRCVDWVELGWDGIGRDVTTRNEARKNNTKQDEIWWVEMGWFSYSLHRFKRVASRISHWYRCISFPIKPPWLQKNLKNFLHFNQIFYFPLRTKFLLVSVYFMYNSNGLNCRYLNPYIKLKLIELAIKLHQEFWSKINCRIFSRPLNGSVGITFWKVQVKANFVFR